MIKIPPEEAYSFDDVLLIPGYSDVLPKDDSYGARWGIRFYTSKHEYKKSDSGGR